MIRRAFIRRMIFAGLATWFLDLPLPQGPGPLTSDAIVQVANALGRAYNTSVDEATWALRDGLDGSGEFMRGLMEAAMEADREMVARIS